MRRYLRSQLGLAAAMIVADELPKSSPKGREHASAPRDEYSQTLSAAADNLSRPREDGENSTEYARRKAAADRLGDQWKDRVALQRWRNHDLREFGKSNILDQEIAFGPSGQPCDLRLLGNLQDEKVEKHAPRREQERRHR